MKLKCRFDVTEISVTGFDHPAYGALMTIRGKLAPQQTGYQEKTPDMIITMHVPMEMMESWRTLIEEKVGEILESKEAKP